MNVQIRKFDPERLNRYDGVLMDGAFPYEGSGGAPFGSTWVVVEPGQSTEPHMHHEVETWFIVRGQGCFAEQHAVKDGDVIYIPPFNRHTLRNEGDEDLLFLAVYWEDLEVLDGTDSEAAAKARAAAEEAARASEAGRSKPVLITATPATPNGDLHLGHLSGPYLAADVYSRYLELRGRQAFYLTGLNDHRSAVAHKGRQIGKSARQTADDFGKALHETLGLAQIEPDVVSYPKTSKYHQERVVEVFTRLWENGQLEAKEAPSLHCETCDLYLYGAHVRGRCPHCEAECCGNACGTCGRPNEGVDLGEPKCSQCGSTPVQRTTRRLYFPLSRWQRQLETFVERAEMNTHLRSLCEAMFEEGLRDISLSHVSEWGIPVPFEGFEGQVLDAGAEMAPAFLAACDELADHQEGLSSGADLWRGPAEVVQFFGFDNGFASALLHPALFLAYDDSIEPAGTFVMNEFYRLEGLKFSNRRMHLIWGRDLIAEMPLDGVRFFLAYSAPETEQTHFTRSQLREVVQRELVDGIGGWLSEAVGRVHGEFEGKVPGSGLWTGAQERFYARLRELQEEAARAYEAPTFSLQTVTRVLCELVREARRFAADELHWRDLPKRFDQRRTSIALEIAAARTLALLAQPVMPDFARRLWSDLGLGDSPETGAWDDTIAFVPGGTSLRLPETPYFDLPSADQG